MAENVNIKKAEVPEDAKIESFSSASIRRDIYSFARYLINKPIQLTSRDSLIPVPVLRKLNECMTFKEEITGYASEWSDKATDPLWIPFIYKILSNLELVRESAATRNSMDSEYEGNEIRLNKSNWENYLNLSSIEKERKILDVLCRITESEFYHPPVYKKIEYRERFSRSGCALNAQQYVSYYHLRKALLAILGALESEKWHDTESFIDSIKTSHPNLILDHRRKIENRANNFYYCFNEYTGKGYEEIEINDKHPDAYSLVEGRYIEYFLETIPFMMDLIDIARVKQKGNMPPCGQITHFKLTEHGRKILSPNAEAEHPNIRILPTFEIFMPHEDFDEKTFLRLENYAEVLSDDRVYHMKIEKKKILKCLEKQEKLSDIISFFKSIAGEDSFPDNVCLELESYGQHAEKIKKRPETSVLEVPDKDAANIIESLYSSFIEKRLDETHFLLKCKSGPDETGLMEKLIADGRFPKLIDYADARRSLNLNFQSGDQLELKFRNKDMFLKKRLERCCSMTAKEPFRWLYAPERNIDKAGLDFLRSNSSNLPESYKKAAVEKNIEIEKVCMINSHDESIMRSIKTCLSENKIKHSIVRIAGKEKALIFEDDIALVKSALKDIFSRTSTPPETKS